MSRLPAKRHVCACGRATVKSLARHDERYVCRGCKHKAQLRQLIRVFGPAVLTRPGRLVVGDLLHVCDSTVYNWLCGRSIMRRDYAEAVAEIGAVTWAPLLSKNRVERLAAAYAMYLTRPRHKKNSSNYHKARYDKRARYGLCVSCERTARPDRRHCIDCAEANKIRRKKAYESAKAAGLCPTCKRPVQLGIICHDCRADNAAKRRAA